MNVYVSYDYMIRLNYMTRNHIHNKWFLNKKKRYSAVVVIDMVVTFYEKGNYLIFVDGMVIENPACLLWLSNVPSSSLFSTFNILVVDYGLCWTSPESIETTCHQTNSFELIFDE